MDSVASESKYGCLLFGDSLSLSLCVLVLNVNFSVFLVWLQTTCHVFRYGWYLVSIKRGTQLRMQKKHTRWSIISLDVIVYIPSVPGLELHDIKWIPNNRLHAASSTHWRKPGSKDVSGLVQRIRNNDGWP